MSRWPLDASTTTGLNAQGFGLSMPTLQGRVTLPQFGPSELAKFGGVKQGTAVAARLVRVGIEWSTPTGWPNLDAYAGQISFRAELSIDGGASFVPLLNAQGQSSYAPRAGNFGASRIG